MLDVINAIGTPLVGIIAVGVMWYKLGRLESRVENHDRADAKLWEEVAILRSEQHESRVILAEVSSTNKMMCKSLEGISNRLQRGDEKFDKIMDKILEGKG